MNFMQIRDLVINLDQILYIDRSRCRLIMADKIEIILTMNEVDEIITTIATLLAQQTQG